MDVYQNICKAHKRIPIFANHTLTTLVGSTLTPFSSISIAPPTSLIIFGTGGGGHSEHTQVSRRGRRVRSTCEDASVVRAHAHGKRERVRAEHGRHTSSEVCRYSSHHSFLAPATQSNSETAPTHDGCDAHQTCMWGSRRRTDTPAGMG